MRLQQLPSLTKSQIDSIQWNGDLNEYDYALCNLGNAFAQDYFIAINPEVDDTLIDHITHVVPTGRCMTWFYGRRWAIKLFKKGWHPNDGRDLLQIPPLTAPRSLYRPSYIWERNKEIPASVSFKNDPRREYTLKMSDLQCIPTWFLDPSATQSSEEIWAFRCNTPNSKYIKNMGLVVPDVNNKFDVIFISYNEPNAEENWCRVLEKAPHAKRVNNVTGILEAHCAAAGLAETDMFYVVDGDAYLVDSWEFDFQPDVLDRNAVHVWYAENPINGLTYGNGGVKLFPKASFDKLEDTKPLDITSFVAKRILTMETVSNTTRFNTDAFSTWKSAVRECAKLYLKTDKESVSRLATWSIMGSDKPFGEYAVAGAAWARKLVDQGMDLTQVNDRRWLQSKFDEIYK